MRSFLAALRTLVLPYGRTTGSRIILDGVNGTITAHSGDGKSLEINPGGATETAFPVIKFYADADEASYSFISGTAVGVPPGLFMWSAPFDIAGVNHRAALRLVASATGGPMLAMINNSGSKHGGFVQMYHDRVALGYESGAITETLEVYSDRAELSVPLKVEGVLVTRRVARNIRTSSIAGFTAETVIATLTFDAVSGRTYSVDYNGPISVATATGNRVQLNVRENDISGTVIGQSLDNDRGFTGQSFSTTVRGEYDAASTGSKTIVVTAARFSGTGTLSSAASATLKAIATVDETHTN